MIKSIKARFKWTYGLSGNDNKVAILPKSYLTVMQRLKSIGQF